MIRIFDLSSAVDGENEVLLACKSVVLKGSPTGYGDVVQVFDPASNPSKMGSKAIRSYVFVRGRMTKEQIEKAMRKDQGGTKHLVRIPLERIFTPGNARVAQDPDAVSPTTRYIGSADVVEKA